MHSPSPPGYDLLTELRLRIVALEGRVSKLEEMKHRAALGIREWWPVILGTIALAGAIMGKLTWGEAFGLLRTLAGSSPGS
jgi:hypothetical protein